MIDFSINVDFRNEIDGYKKSKGCRQNYTIFRTFCIKNKIQSMSTMQLLISRTINYIDKQTQYLVSGFVHNAQTLLQSKHLIIVFICRHNCCTDSN